MALNILDLNFGPNFGCRPLKLDSWLLFVSARFAASFSGSPIVAFLTKPVQSRWQTSEPPEKMEKVSADLYYRDILPTVVS